MKRFSLIAAIFVIAFTALTGCKDETAPKPIFTSTTEGDIVVPAVGGDFEITYTLENPAEDGKVHATADQFDWISDFNCETSGTVTFKVAPNEAETPREGEVTVVYEYSGDPQSFTVKVTQAAKGADPVLTLTSDSEIAAEATGGDFEITFTLENPAEDGELKAEADSWITTTVNASSIAVKVAANESEEAREGNVTVTYTWSGEPQSFTVKVTQKGIGGTSGEIPFTIEIPEDEITASSAHVISTRLDASLTWHADVMSQSDYDYYGGDMEEYFLYVLEYMAEYNYTTIPDLLAGGFAYDYDEDDYTYTGLSPQTAYKAYAVGVDLEGNITTDFCIEDFTTLEMQLGNLTFDIETTPKTTSVLLDVYPSDKSACYWTTVIDDSFYDAGYTDEDIMTEIINNIGIYIMFGMGYYGDQTGLEITGMSPQTHYYAVAFGVDETALTYNSEMAKVEFTTLESQPTDAYATASIDNYWSIEDLAAYNPDYSGLLSDPTNPVLAAVDFEYNEEATSCIYILWIGDQSAADKDELYSATLSQGDIALKGDPAPLFYVAFDSDPTTLCVIGTDANGNYGDMYMDVVTFPESGKSTDYALFDEYYNALMGGSSYSVSSVSQGELIKKPVEMTETPARTVITAASSKKQAEPNGKITKFVRVK
ncbi:MAG: BACON domain-containing protein [Bacteroidetes bacterium]|uniref:BACON domain-containing protein n=1 Tax=Candidatus Merdivivens pullistercoris TaxID=2840873 RepID=A0A9D9I391_9BACT|nr:BACON domain-containing protein [Candidatus Merdivivens pullistercoris]